MDGTNGDSTTNGRSGTQGSRDLASIIDDALRSEQEAAGRRAKHIDEGSDFPGLTVGPEKMPDPGSTDWREMAPIGSAARAQAAAEPQKPEEFQTALEDVAELRRTLGRPPRG
jgi:hypothetical protein